jgi:photosystem II stability/assembly factor-like uncharacterized protein
MANAHAIAAAPVGPYAAVAGTGHTLLRSDDAGATWRSVELGQDLDLRDVVVEASGEVVAVGAGGVVATIDATDAVSVTTPASTTLRALYVSPTGRGLAVGDAGTVLSTVDGGASWDRLELGLTGAMMSVDDVGGEL